MGAKLEAYRRGARPSQTSYWLWPLYGKGLENLGVNDQPIQAPLLQCKPNELLVRHDAVGLCFSDTKVIKAGEDHPRLTGRDMRTHPVVLGHEVALTVVDVGSNLTDRFKPGQRFIVQADIYYRGVGYAYGYALQGGLSQHNIVGTQVLEGDEGCYLLPIPEGMGYAQAALTEPWACVVASYSVEYRQSWMANGSILIVAGPDHLTDYELGTPYPEGAPPARVVAVGLSGNLLEALRARSEQDGFVLQEIPSLEKLQSDTFDDIVLLGTDEKLYELVEPLGAKGCLYNLVGAQGLRQKAQVDVGRLHYDHVNLVGTISSVISDAYKPIRTELRPGGRAALLGAAGPMGQMHFQRALQAQSSPRLLVATDLDRARLELLKVKYADLISRNPDTRILLRVPGDTPPDAFNSSLVAETGGDGFDDIVVLAPSAGVVAGAADMLAPNGMLNIFAGLPRGTRAAIDLRLVVEKGVRFTGSSGSRIKDLQLMLEEASSGRLDPNMSVVAVSGFRDAKKGLEGVIHQRFPGKVVIYPQILDFPLTLLTDLKHVLPGVHAKLGPNHTWTVEAEQAFLEELLP